MRRLDDSFQGDWLAAGRIRFFGSRSVEVFGARRELSLPASRGRTQDRPLDWFANSLYVPPTMTSPSDSAVSFNSENGLTGNFLFGNSPAMLDLKHKIALVANTDVPV